MHVQVHTPDLLQASLSFELPDLKACESPQSAVDQQGSDEDVSSKGSYSSDQESVHTVGNLSDILTDDLLSDCEASSRHADESTNSKQAEADSKATVTAGTCAKAATIPQETDKEAAIICNTAQPDVYDSQPLSTAAPTEAVEGRFENSKDTKGHVGYVNCGTSSSESYPHHSAEAAGPQQQTEERKAVQADDAHACTPAQQLTAPSENGGVDLGESTRKAFCETVQRNALIVQSSLIQEAEDSPEKHQEEEYPDEDFSLPSACSLGQLKDMSTPRLESSSWQASLQRPAGGSGQLSNGNANDRPQRQHEAPSRRPSLQALQRLTQSRNSLAAVRPGWSAFGHGKDAAVAAAAAATGGHRFVDRPMSSPAAWPAPSSALHA